jgi:hypothetical protein
VNQLEKSVEQKSKLIRRRTVVTVLALIPVALAVFPCSPVRAETNAKAEKSTVRRTAASPDSLEGKIEELSRLPSEQPQSFKPIVITESEANEYLKSRGQEFLPHAVRNPAIYIQSDQVSGGADIDFDQLEATGKATNDIGSQVLGTLFKGKQRVSATGKLDALDGKGHLTIENLRIGTTTVPDWLTKAMLAKYLEDTYRIDLDKPFPLPDHVTRIDLADGKATFIRSPNKKP